MSVDITEIKEKVLLVNIVNTHHSNRKELDTALGELLCNCEKISPEEKIQGAAQCFWLLDEKKVKRCEYVFAVSKGEVCGVFKFDKEKKLIRAPDVVAELDKLKQKGQYVNYPPYRDIEIKAHIHDELQKIKAMKYQLDINENSFQEALKQIPAIEEKDLKLWNNRKFLCLTPCDENDPMKIKYEKQRLNRGKKSFSFYGAVEYFPKEKRI